MHKKVHQPARKGKAMRFSWRMDTEFLTWSLIAAFLYILLNSAQVVALPSVGKEPQTVEDRFVPEIHSIRVESWIEDLDIPWSLVFLPQGDAVVSERPGRMRLIKEGRLRQAPYAVLEVVHQGEGGLLGLALYPQFPKEPFVYAVHTYRRGGDRYNRVVRLRHLGETGSFDRVILDGIPGSRLHNGGRIAFGPDGLLYITAGDTFDSDLAQDLGSLGGKIPRVIPEGEAPQENPFSGSAVYSYGHRNPQGLTWHPRTGTFSSLSTGLQGSSCCSETTK